MKPYYERAGITIYHDHLFAFLHECPIVDCAIADPPYGQTSLTWDKWVHDWPERVRARTRSLWCFGTLRMFMDHVEDFSKWKMSQDIVWEKHNGSSFHRDRFRRVHEQAVHFYSGSWEEIYKSTPQTNNATARQVRRKRRPAHMGHIEASSYISVDGGPKLQRSVIFEPSCHGYAQNETQKPIGIIRPLIEYACPPDGVILDCFMGAGSALIAAKQLGRRAIGIDIREDQCEIAVKRLMQEVFEFT